MDTAAVHTSLVVMLHTGQSLVVLSHRSHAVSADRGIDRKALMMASDHTSQSTLLVHIAEVAGAARQRIAAKDDSSPLTSRR
jgi:hypothetical protein